MPHEPTLSRFTKEKKKDYALGTGGEPAGHHEQVEEARARTREPLSPLLLLGTRQCMGAKESVCT